MLVKVACVNCGGKGYVVQPHLGGYKGVCPVCHGEGKETLKQ